MKSVKERAKEYADNYMVGDSFIIVGLLHKVAEESYIQGDADRKAIDIETIPQLYVRWLMIDGEKPTWEEYATKAMEE